MSVFIFDSYYFDESTTTARFNYRFDSGDTYTETVEFREVQSGYDRTVLDRVMFLAFILIGISYYKSAPTRTVEIKKGVIDEWQASFFTRVFQEGLSQFAYENQLAREDLAVFTPTGEPGKAVDYHGDGILSLQSGGKDSLLVAQMLEKTRHDFYGFYVSSSEIHPKIIEALGSGLWLAKRSIDHQALQRTKGMNGHVPVTYIVLSLSLVQAVLGGVSTVLAGIGHEGEEPHVWVGDLAVNHQWSKTWQAEQLFAEYVGRYIATNLRVGSPLRGMSELDISRRFVELAWSQYARSFSSCNVANYRQGENNTVLSWCAACPKCANSYVLFSPFLEASELQSIFGGDLYSKPELQEIFKGLLGVEGVMKPFECVGEIDELRYAYHAAQRRGGYSKLAFVVPPSAFNPDIVYPAQDFSDLLP